MQFTAERTSVPKESGTRVKSGFWVLTETKHDTTAGHLLSSQPVIIIITVMAGAPQSPDPITVAP